MTIDEKIKAGLVALSVVSAVVVSAHFGHVTAHRPPILDLIGPGAGSS